MHYIILSNCVLGEGKTSWFGIRGGEGKGYVEGFIDSYVYFSDPSLY